MTRRLLVLLTACAAVPFLAGCPPKRTSETLPASPSASTPLTPTPTPAPTPEAYDATLFKPMSPLAMTSRVPVIMYHDVTKERGRDSVYFDTTKAEFEEQIAWLEEQGASFISLTDLHKHLTRGEPIPPRAICLTFDDNYQGFYDNAYPLLKEKKIPSAMFVHTDFVGRKTNADGSPKAKPNMDWDTLRELDKDGLVTIASHTLSHPPDMTKLSPYDQDKELTESKTILERELGHPVPFFAYPVGKGDKNTFDAAQAAGYTMAFTMANGPAEESPGILRINRYIQTKLKEAWEECDKATINAPAAVVDIKLGANPVLLQVAEFDGIKLGIVRGGKPSTWRTGGGRQTVGEFIKAAEESGQLTEKPVGGMNGTFFADASLRGTDNVLIGPCLTHPDNQFLPETAEYRLPKLVNRPLVLMGPSRLMIVPFNPYTMNDEESLKTVMPDVTDIFLGGAWIVHDGVARTKEEMGVYSARDFNDPRRRAFFGITDSGDVVLGGSLEVITTETLAKAAAAAGIKEAVLMDSGFSTSIVFDNKIIVTGHTAKNLPSRTVPHAVLVSGQMEQPTDPETLQALKEAKPAVGAVSGMEAQDQAPRPGRRRRR